MTWTREKPTAPGHFWHWPEIEGVPPLVVRVDWFSEGKTLYVFATSHGRMTLLSDVGGVWCGPIEAPPLPEVPR